MEKKEEKKLTLNKTTIANLNNSGMKSILGGGNTEHCSGVTLGPCGTGGPQCDTANTCQTCGETYNNCQTILATDLCCL